MHNDNSSLSARVLCAIKRLHACIQQILMKVSLHTDFHVFLLEHMDKWFLNAVAQSREYLGAVLIVSQQPSQRQIIFFVEISSFNRLVYLIWIFFTIYILLLFVLPKIHSIFVSLIKWQIFHENRKRKKFRNILQMKKKRNSPKYSTHTVYIITKHALHLHCICCTIFFAAKVSCSPCAFAIYYYVFFFVCILFTSSIYRCICGILYWQRTRNTIDISETNENKKKSNYFFPHIRISIQVIFYIYFFFLPPITPYFLNANLADFGSQIMCTTNRATTTI